VREWERQRLYLSVSLLLDKLSADPRKHHTGKIQNSQDRRFSASVKMTTFIFLRNSVILIFGNSKFPGLL